MRKSFFLNYLTAHQLSLALVFDAMPDIEHTRVSVIAGGGNAGRANHDHGYPFVIRAYKGESVSVEAMRHAIEDDIAVFQHMGGHEEYVRARAATGKPFFRATERLLKRGSWWRWMSQKIFRTWKWFTQYKDSPMRVFCVAAERFVEYSKALLDGRELGYASGPMSPCAAGDRR